MNENIDLTEILSKCPKGTKLYSPMLGEVTLVSVSPFKITVEAGNCYWYFTKLGHYIYTTLSTPPDTEMTLFPSKDQRDWNQFEICEDYNDGDIFILDRKDTFSYWIFSRKKQENPKQIMSYFSINFDRKTRKDIGYFPEGPLASKDYKPGELRKASYLEELIFKTALIARGYFTMYGKTLYQLKFKVGDKVCKKGSSDILTITQITTMTYVCKEDHIGYGFPILEQSSYELAPCETEQYDIQEIKPGKVYWFQVTEDIKKNEILLQRLLLKSQGKIKEGKRNRYSPGDLIYLQDNKMKICEYAKGSYYAIRMFGTEIKLTPKK